MHKIKTIDIKDFILQTIPRTTEFIYDQNHYKVTIFGTREVRQSYYLSEINITKNDSIFLQGIVEDMVELNLSSKDNRFLFIPFINNPKIYDLKLNKDITLDITPFVRCNQFDKSGKYSLVSSLINYQIIDIISNKVIYASQNGLSISRVRFGYDNSIWTLDYEKDTCILKKQNPQTLAITSEFFPSPFEFYNLDIEKYRVLQDPTNHNLWRREGGQLISSHLNKWEYISTTNKNRIIYRTVLPISAISYTSANIPHCKVDYTYIEVINN